MKVVFVVVDGLADFPVEGKTPLIEAKKPNINYFCRNGKVGELSLLPKGLEVWTHLCMISLLGYDPLKVYNKRGPIEAIGNEIPFKEGYLALRCNFATVDKELRVIDRRAGRSDYGLKELCSFINSNLKFKIPFEIFHTLEHRAVLIFKMDLSDKITSNDPLKENERVREISALDSESLITAKILQEFLDKVHDLIKENEINLERREKGIPEANYLLVREAGNKLPKLSNFLRKWKIKKAGIISEPGAAAGVFMLANFNSFLIDSRDFESSLEEIFFKIKVLMEEYNFLVAHIKGPDQASHDGNYELKKEMIEKIDEKMEIFKKFKGVLVFTCDHITSSFHRKHLEGNVPLLLYGKGKDRVRKFDEISVKKGSLKVITPKKLLEILFGKNT